jgi:hypothetical protein
VIPVLVLLVEAEPDRRGCLIAGETVREGGRIGLAIRAEAKTRASDSKRHIFDLRFQLQLKVARMLPSFASTSATEHSRSLLHHKHRPRSIRILDLR